MSTDTLSVEWRGEVSQRLQAYRAKRRKAGGNDGQTALPFADEPPADQRRAAVGVSVEEPHPPAEADEPKDDFAFTIAIGRPAKKVDPEEEGRMVIDVSLPPLVEESGEAAAATKELTAEPMPLYPVASIDERRRAGWIDVACLAFAYGGFLALFGSLGGHFTMSKLSAAVCFFTFAFVYVQYFGLFTIFGGTTPGMMMAGLQVTSFTSEPPTPRQLALRALGYLISAGTFFLGFFWALWDEDALTWHDRLSRTYLSSPTPVQEESLQF